MLGEHGKFDVEHALSIFADDFLVMPASEIYNCDTTQRYRSIVDNCHIYLIGTLPPMQIERFDGSEGLFKIDFSILHQNYRTEIEVPNLARCQLVDGVCYLYDTEDRRININYNQFLRHISNLTKRMVFNVLYIGQSFGQNGERNSLDRLKSHETLQRISLSEDLKGEALHVLLLSINDENRTFTIFNPFAKKSDDDGSRISNGVEKLFQTSDKERTTIFEASLIRFFEPKYNKELKNSFPSTKMKILKDCYAKDFSSVIAEICNDYIPFGFKSDKIEFCLDVMAIHNLHTEEERKAFFF